MIRRVGTILKFILMMKYSQKNRTFHCIFKWSFAMACHWIIISKINKYFSKNSIFFLFFSNYWKACVTCMIKESFTETWNREIFLFPGVVLKLGILDWLLCVSRSINSREITIVLVNRTLIRYSMRKSKVKSIKEKSVLHYTLHQSKKVHPITTRKQTFIPWVLYCTKCWVILVLVMKKLRVLKD